MPTVNLDAMIPREDFQVDGENRSPESNRNPREMLLTALSPEGSTLPTLRKPDFQRETSSWTPEIIMGFVRSFLDGDVIPAVIMWRSPRTGNVFVIDGAHRLSALIAWIHDDYGDKSLSRAFFQNAIEPDQEKIAQKTRSLIAREVGLYKDLFAYIKKPEGAPDQKAILRARNIATFPLFLQWVEGSASAAEASFVRINSGAAAINKTERALIEARRKPNAIATRALMRAGTGHKFWSTFDPTHKADLEEIAKEVYDHLFRPIVEFPITTVDLPVAGRAYSADSVKMIFELVNFLSRNPAAPKETREAKEIADDNDGAATIQLLKRVQKMTTRVFGNDAGSLGLHPGVYCYGATGKFNPQAFIGAIAFMKDLETRNQFKKFTQHRAKFEEFLLKHRFFINQVVADKGSGNRGLPTLVRLYQFVLERIVVGNTDDEIVAALKADPDFSFLYIPSRDERRHGRNFSKETKAAVALKEGLENEARCKICGARLYFKAVSFDHRVRKQDGGTGAPDNAQQTHPYCNTGFKESEVSKERAAAG